MGEPTGYDKESVERYVMHLIELKGYERRKLKDLAEADDIHFDELELDPEGMPEDVFGDTLFYSWNEYIDKYPERNTDLSFTWEQFYSLPEDYRIQVEDGWEFEFSGNDHEDEEWLMPEGIDPKQMFQFLDDMMMYDWLRKNNPDGENKNALEERRNAVRRRIAETISIMESKKGCIRPPAPPMASLPKICRCIAPVPDLPFVKNGIYRWEYGIDNIFVYHESGATWHDSEIMFTARFQILSGKD